MATRIETRTQVYQSDIVTVATTATITGINPAVVNHFGGCRYYTSSAGTTTAVPTAGTIAVNGRDVTTDQFTSFSGSPLTCTDVTDKVSASANMIEAQAIPAGITGPATHYQLFVSSNV